MIAGGAERDRVLVACVGNLFLGDDGFGVEVARRLLARPAREGVRVRDFGIRGLDLLFALERCDAAVIVDTVRRGGPAGTLYVLAPDEADGWRGLPDGHAMTPDRVLGALDRRAMPRVVRVLGCEPASFGGEDGAMGLTPEVDAALGPAVELVDKVVTELLGDA